MLEGIFKVQLGKITVWKGIFKVQLGKITVWKGMHLKSSTYRFNNCRLIYDCQNICKKFSGLKFGLKLDEHNIYQIIEIGQSL